MEKNELKPGAGLNVTSLVLGIVSIVLMCVVYVSIPAAILAIVFGAAGMKHEGRGMGIAGLVCGIISAAIIFLCYAGILSIINF